MAQPKCRKKAALPHLSTSRLWLFVKRDAPLRRIFQRGRDIQRLGCKEMHIVEPPLTQLGGPHDFAQFPNVQFPCKLLTPQHERYLVLTVDQCHFQIAAKRPRHRKVLSHQVFDMMDVCQHLDRLANANDTSLVRGHYVEGRAVTAGTLGRLVAGGQRLRQRPERRDPIDRMAALPNTLGTPKYLRRQPHLRWCATEIEAWVLFERRARAADVRITEIESRHGQRPFRAAER